MIMKKMNPMTYYDSNHYENLTCKFVGGVLCWRHNENDTWKKYSQYELSMIIKELEEEREEHNEGLACCLPP